MCAKRKAVGREWELTPDKYLNDVETGQMLRRADELWTLGEAKQRKGFVRDAFLIHTALFTGLRCSEICDLKVTDLRIGNGEASLIVRHGKGGKQRVVHIGAEYKRIVKRYLQWKQDAGELDPDAYLLRTERAPRYCASALWRRWKKHCPKHRLHDARHTNATMLYRASGNNLRLVQKQLGHSRITTTQIYADVLPDQARASMTSMERLAGRAAKGAGRSILAVTRGETGPQGADDGADDGVTGAASEQ